MEGFFSFGKKKEYIDFKRQIPLVTIPLFDSIRKFCLSLGENVIEDVRMHRIVFGKLMVFRWFADIEPRKYGVIIKIQRNRKEAAQVFHIANNQKLSNFENLIKEAYLKIN